MEDKPSCFYISRFSDRPFPFTYLLLEHITGALKDLGDQAGNEDLALSVVQDSIAACGIRKKPSSDDIVYAVGRMQESYRPEGAVGETPATNTRMFAGEYLQWVQGLTPETTCLYLADYDMDRARYLYCEVDCDEVRILADEKISRDWQVIKVGFESVLFGFGGGYGEGEDGFDPPPPPVKDDGVQNYALLDGERRDKLHQQMGF